MVISAQTRNINTRSIMYLQDDKGRSTEICRNGLAEEKSRELYLEFKRIADSNTSTKNKYVTAVISPPKEYSAHLNSWEWALLAEDYLRREGIGKDNQYLVYLHESTDDKHLHIIANRIDFQGKNTVKSHNIGARATQHGEALSKHRNWKTIKEISSEKKQNIKKAILQEKYESHSMEEFIHRMRARGYIFLINSNSKGINGARIVPAAEFNAQASKKNSKQGFKLSEIDSKLKIKDIINEFSAHKNPIIRDRGRTF